MPQTLTLDAGTEQVVQITGQTSIGPASPDVLGKTSLSIDNPAIATVGPVTVDPSTGNVSFTVQSIGVGAATISATNGGVPASLPVQVDPVPPAQPLVQATWGQPDGSPCVTTCTLTVSFQQPAGGTNAVTAWTACLEPQDVCTAASPDTPYTSILDSSSGALTGEFNAQVGTDAAGESIKVTAVAGQLSAVGTTQIPTPPWQTQPPPGTPPST